jgi:hypothetical protein
MSNAVEMAMRALESCLGTVAEPDRQAAADATTPPPIITSP